MQMWAVLYSTGVFFVAVVAMLLMDMSVYQHAQNFIAFFVLTGALFLYNCVVVIDCTQQNPTFCRYLYPVSGSAILEASISLVLTAMLYLAALFAILSTSFIRVYLRVAISYGGFFQTCTNVIVMLLTLTYTIMQSCPGDVNMYTKISQSTTSLYWLLACVSPLVFASPVLLSLQSGEILSWDDFMTSEKGNYCNSKCIQNLQVCILHYNEKSFACCN